MPLVLLLIVAYRVFNPELIFFPPCPFYVITDFKCPGCGSQRAIHHLLNFNLKDAYYQNSLLVLSLPYVSLGLFLEFYTKSHKTLDYIRSTFYGHIAAYVWLFLIVAFWIIRNI